MPSRKKLYLGCNIPELTREEEARMPSAAPLMVPVPQHLALVLESRWGEKADLGVSFLEPVTNEFRDKILLYANKWSEANGGGDIRFRWSQSGGPIRVTREGDGYWSYLGRQALGIASGQPTLCLSRFAINTSDREWDRVVVHEFGHALGCPHEHMRAELVARLDEAKTIAYFRQNQGWNANMTRSQVLTPIDRRSIIGTPEADAESIMCYMLPGSITKDGRPIVGGSRINVRDLAFAREVMYPVTSAPPPPPPGDKITFTVEVDVVTRAVRIVP